MIEYGMDDDGGRQSGDEGKVRFCGLSFAQGFRNYAEYRRGGTVQGGGSETAIYPHDNDAVLEQRKDEKWQRFAVASGSISGNRPERHPKMRN